MQSKQCFFCAILFLCILIANGKNNCSKDIMKMNVSFPSPERWSFFVPNVYLTNDYNPNESPNAVNHDPVTVSFEDIKIIDVDQEKKKVTLDLTIFMIWKDDGIRVINNNDDFVTWLPPITINNLETDWAIPNKNRKPPIWTPLKQISVVNERNRRYQQPPVVMGIGIFGIDAANRFFAADNFVGNTSTVFVGSQIDWRLTIWCPFDFSHFPFDKNICHVDIRFGNINVMFPDKQFLYYKDNIQNNAAGFVIEISNVDPRKVVHPRFGSIWTHIGFQISMKRQAPKYIYQYYLPCIAIVITSSFSFIIPLSALPGRVGLTVTLFLTLTNIFIVHMVTYIYAKIL